MHSFPNVLKIGAVDNLLIKSVETNRNNIFSKEMSQFGVQFISLKHIL